MEIFKRSVERDAGQKLRGVPPGTSLNGAAAAYDTSSGGTPPSVFCKEAGNHDRALARFSSTGICILNMVTASKS
jgi:hypothetical protein